MEVFEATHIAPGRWGYHPVGRSASCDRYPRADHAAYVAVWLPPVRCKALIFFDHSTGHGAFAKNALNADRGNKMPDWNGRVEPQRDGWFYLHGDKNNRVRYTQSMQFKEGDVLPCDIKIPKGIDPDAAPDAAAARTPAAPTAPQPPPTDAELTAAFKRFFQGAQQTLKKKHPQMTADGIRSLGQDKWGFLTTEQKMVYISRVRAAAAATAAPQTNEERVLKAGSPVPRRLWGRHKGLQVLLLERELYRDGLKGSCENNQAHTSKECCCSRLLSVQIDFAAEVSALQHLVEARIPLGELFAGSLRHLCLFLPKVTSPPIARLPLLLTLADCAFILRAVPL